MSTVNVVVNGRPYGVGCEDGQEAHVEALAKSFDQQVQEVGAQVGQVGDLRLFLMAALVTADELADAKLRLAQAQSQLAAHSGAVSTPPTGASAQAIQTASTDDRRALAALENAATRIEALIDHLA